MTRYRLQIMLLKQTGDGKNLTNDQRHGGDPLPSNLNICYKHLVTVYKIRHFVLIIIYLNGSNKSQNQVWRESLLWKRWIRS
jgi:hypothetical protein